ncbi:hypothetical protein LBMAG41_13420 [Cyanobium sp.]|nr:hypothetical protein LBMAG41_13420 [Cyanobium sp.]
MAKSSVGKTTVEINGVDYTAALDQLADEQRELTKAQELTSYMLKEHLAEAAKTSIAGRFTMGLSLTFDRLPGRTSIKAKVGYSRKFSDELEGFAQHQQGDLFDSVEDGE